MESQRNLYLFSGLGADERVFQALDFSGYQATFIQWISPEPNETIEHYTTRLLEQVNVSDPIFIGLSFGGIIAVEAAKQMAADKLILIASAKERREIPWYFRLAGTLRLHFLLPARLLKSPNPVTNWFFGVRSASEKQLLKQILADTDPVFLKWAIDKIVRWRNRERPAPVFHVHGTHDRILPACFVRCDVAIRHGGHFMTLNKAGELNQVLRRQLSW